MMLSGVCRCYRVEMSLKRNHLETEIVAFMASLKKSQLGLPD